MIATDGKDRNAKLEEYLQLLRLLAFELDRGMEAISQNSLTALEDSVANQEVFSTRLAELADDLSLFEQGAPASHQVPPDAGLISEIASASSAVQNLNRRYAALIRLSSESVALMVSLFTSFQGHMREGSGASLRYQTWSCQM